MPIDVYFKFMCKYSYRKCVLTAGGMRCLDGTTKEDA